VSWLLSLLLIAIAMPVGAQVYKCSNDKGGVVYQDAECTAGKDLGNVDVDPAHMNVIPSRPPAVGKAGASKPVRLQAIPAQGGDAKQRRFLAIGMSEAEVIEKVGRPDVEGKAGTKALLHWTYLPTAGDPATQTTLTFSGGKVALVERKVVPH
jgi:hypothetical protein